MKTVKEIDHLLRKNGELDRELSKAVHYLVSNQAPFNKVDGSSPGIMKRWEEKGLHPRVVKTYKRWVELNKKENELKEERLSLILRELKREEEQDGRV